MHAWCNHDSMHPLKQSMPVFEQCAQTTIRFKKETTPQPSGQQCPSARHHASFPMRHYSIGDLPRMTSYSWAADNSLSQRTLCDHLGRNGRRNELMTGSSSQKHAKMRLHIILTNVLRRTSQCQE